MRASRLLIATQKEIPAEAEVVSHRLMLRAGMIRKLASGLYTWLPLGLKVLHKVQAIIRAEMDLAGAQEVLMPVVQPAELWQESERWEQYGPELLRLEDRHNRSFCLGPTHEEIITDLIRNEIRSYKQLPANFYQIQTKFRDEIRPRYGVMRAREFIMKDAYSFHADDACLQKTYDLMHTTYTRIFTRIGLEFRPVLADTGSIGGSFSHEFHVLAESGEDAIAFSTESDYAANVEMAETLPPQTGRPPGTQDMALVATPEQHSIEEVCNFLDCAIDTTVKTLIVNGSKEGELIALVIRGDHSLNEKKAEKLPDVASPLRFATGDQIQAALDCGVGSLGPVNLSIPLITDHSAAHLSDFVCGANKDGYHLCGVNWERDCRPGLVADLRMVITGDPSPDGRGVLDIKRGIEVGHIFQLGTKYSAAMQASILGQDGREQVMTMGCYGIGVTRVVAAAIEQNNDERGIIWPESIAPFSLAIVPINAQKSEAVQVYCETLYQQLINVGYDALLMDEDKARLGAMLADLELIGIPHRLVVGERGLDAGTVEYKRRGDFSPVSVKLAELTEFLAREIGSR